MSGARRLLDDREHVLFLQDQVVLVVDLDLRARVLAEEDLVAGFDVEGDLLALLRHPAVPHGDPLALLWLFLGGVGGYDGPLPRSPLLDTLDEDAVVQRTNFHGEVASY